MTPCTFIFNVTQFSVAYTIKISIAVEIYFKSKFTICISLHRPVEEKNPYLYEVKSS